MKQVLTVFQYTFKEGIRKKAFWVSTITKFEIREPSLQEIFVRKAGETK